MNKKEKIFYFVLFVVFVVLSLLVGMTHEQWADEAHAWMIARDTSFYSLFFQYLHTDGHPALWHLILKFFQFIGVEYKHIYVISTIFSSAGVGIFLFKSNFKWYIKVLLPFSYFVFYQYTVVARGYCLILLLLSLIASIWDNRLKKCYLFTFYLILLMSCEAYTFMLAGMIYLILVYDYIKGKEKIKNSKSLLSCLIILPIFFILTVLYVYPISSNTFGANGPIYYISDSFFTNYIEFEKLKLIWSFAIVIFIYWCYKKDFEKKKFFEMVFFLLPVFCFLYFKYYNVWHLGILFLIFFFILWIQKFNMSFYLNVFLSLCLMTQVFWSVYSSVYDINNNYASSKDVANFIKKYNYESFDIYGATFYESGINPYFDKNIFDNWDQNIGFFYWNTRNVFYKTTLSDKEYEMIIYSDIYLGMPADFFQKFDLIKNDYNLYYFPASTCAENFIYEPMGTYVYVLKKVDKIPYDSHLIENSNELFIQ